MDTKLWSRAKRTATRVIGELTSVHPAPQECLDDFGAGTRHTAVMGGTEIRGTAHTANVVVADCSGSTASAISQADERTKLAGIKEAFSLFAARLPASAMLAVIRFCADARVVWPMARLSTDKLDVIQQIQALVPSGQTAMCQALELAAAELRKVPAGYMLRAYVLSDGLSTDGSPLRAAQVLKSHRTQVHTIGFGAGAGIDEAAMRAMASTSADGQPLFHRAADLQTLTAFCRRQSSTVTL